MSTKSSGALGLVLIVLSLHFFFSRAPHLSGVEPTLAGSGPVSPTLSVSRPGATSKPATLESNFDQVTERAWQTFVSVAQTRPDPNDVDQLPRPLFKIAAELGRVTEALHRDPLLIPKGIAFYRACATAENDLYSVRAVCLRNLKFWEEKSGARFDADSLSVPAEVARIAKALPVER